MPPAGPTSARLRAPNMDTPSTGDTGELNFNLVGVLSQLGSQVSESLRLSLIQILLQGRGIKLNPITTLYYVAPACFCFLLLPWLAIELPQMRVDTTWSAPVGLLTISATAALGKQAGGCSSV